MSTTDLRSRLEALPPEARERLLLELIRESAADLLGFDSARDVDPDRAFADLGFTSVAAVELSRILGEATGLELPPTLGFDYPTPEAVAGRLAAELGDGAAASGAGRRDGRGSQPIAIVGMSCRYPGGVGSPEDLWRLVAEGRDGTGEFPRDRGWDVDAIYDPDPDRLRHVYTRRGGFLADAADFDAELFGIGPQEAVAMDPQHRLLLEGSWEAFERAGLDPRSLRGTAAGVFVGLTNYDYGAGLTDGPAGEDLEGFVATGTTGSTASGRIAYTFGLEGPAISIDTACSSSLVALHLAAQSLRSGDCDLALAGGVSVIASPRVFVEFCRQRLLSPDGRCRSFSADADGTGWSEGLGLVLLEPLEEARRHGHPVLAVLRGSAINQDGRSNGLTAPNGPAQERVIRQALGSCGLTPAEVDAIEAHGTGTTLGDPIEAEALFSVFGREQEREVPLRLGSLKSNIGHAQSAAGVGGVIKMVEALRHEALPRTLHASSPTPVVDWERGAISLLHEEQPWPRGERPRRAGVSAFGISGTNAHVLVEEAPAEEPADGVEPLAEQPDPPLRGAFAWPLSAAGPEALRGQAERLAEWVRGAGAPRAQDVAASLAGTRADLAHRAVAVGAGGEQLLAALDALARGERGEGIAEGLAHDGRVAFLFPGQGSQWAAMGAGLLESSPVFAERIRACERALSPYLDWSLERLLRGEAGAPPLERVEVVQPALFATMVALAALWRELGVEPDAVVGHSQGEYAAAHVAGALSLEDAARMVALRSKALAELAGKGGMASVALPPGTLAERIEPYGDRISLAALNAPSSQAVAGDPEALERLVAECEQDDIWARMIPVDYASHTPRVETIREQLLESLAPSELRPNEVPMLSTVNGEWVDGTAMDAGYWYRNLRQTVRFEPAIRRLLEEGFGTFVEVSPHPVLTIGVEQAVEEAQGAGGATAIGTLRRDDGGPVRFLASVAEAHAGGAEVDFARLTPGARRVELPTYAFARRRHWALPSASAAGVAGSGLVPFEHPLLAAAAEIADEEGWLFSGRLSLEAQPWLADHAVMEVVLLSGTAFVELALAIGGRLGCELLEELTLEAPLTVPEGEAVTLQVRVGPADESGRRSLAIYSRRGEAELGEEGAAPFTRHAQGTLLAGAGAEPEGDADWPAAGEEIDVAALYERLFEHGFGYGPLYRGLEAAWHAGDGVLAEVGLPAEGASGFRLHPALLDAAFHAFGSRFLGEGDGASLPFSWRGVRIDGDGSRSLRVLLRPAGEGAVALTAVDEAGAPVVSVESVAVRPVSAAQLGGAGAGEDLLGVEWEQFDPGDDAAEEVAVLGKALEGLEARSYQGLEQLVAALDEGSVPPATVVVPPFEAEDGDEAEEGHATARAALGLLTGWLAESRLGASRLVFLTRGAQAVGTEEAPHLAEAPLWGLVRAAQAEHPGRFAIVDLDPAGESAAGLAAILAGNEPQAALRGAAAFVPRLRRLAAEGAVLPSLDPDGTVLVTGGTAGIGALLARHLVEHHGARNLLLVSRRGEEAEGAQRLREKLAELGAEVSIGACDVARRSEVERLLAGVPAEHPLTAVVHSAGVIDDGLLESMTPERLDAVMAPKVDAAAALDALTADLDLDAFVLFSSAAGTFGSAGQANYAAANAFLDALAQHRRTLGRPATSIAWGLWETESEMTGHLDEAARERLRRAGLAAIRPQQGCALFDRALSLGRGAVVAAPLERRRLVQLAQAGELPPLAQGLVPATPRRREEVSSGFARRLSGLEQAEREAVVSELVRGHAAAVLGRSSAAEIGADLTFKALGMDSLAALEFRNRLAADIGLRVPATLAFDHPTPAAVVAHLLERVGRQAPAAAARPSVKRDRGEDPIAIVGIGCRYPGGVASAADFWSLLEEGRDAVRPFPDDRGWELERLYHPDPDHPGTTYTREGGFVDGCMDFDAGFFEISRREALAMDPQQRLLLEVAWEAFEHANIDPTRLRGSATGVFVGLMYQNYGPLLHRVPPELEGYLGTGTAGSVASGRIAYSFGFEGPAVTVDTACSASLVSLHMACQALRGGECDLALAGGATLMTSPGIFLEFSRKRGVALDGRCKSFSEQADGTGWSEGTGLILVERLSDARRQGHRVLALVRGSAVNQDGASNGLTAPNGPAQERVIQQALANAGVEAAEVDAVEGHGTGTMLGDPIEAEAIHATYGAAHSPDHPVRIGSVKSNIAHSQAAAGVAGVIKVALALQHGLLPKTLHAEEPSGKVDWSSGTVEVLAQPVPWPRGGRPRRAGVSSFGVSGTNAHVIVEEAPAEEAAAPAGGASEAGPQVAVPLLVSAKDEAALADQGARLAELLESRPEVSPLDLGRSLCVGRSRFPVRAGLVAQSREELIPALRALAEGGEAPGLVRASAVEGGLAFLFAGQGRQRAGMGKELAAAFPPFAEALERVCAELDPHLERPLREVMHAEPESPEAFLLEQTAFTQPALFALEVALFRLLESWGVAPGFLIGHSVGELAAAHVAGVLSLADAAALVATRGRLMQDLPPGGAMFAVEASAAEAEAELAGLGEALSLAAVNGPRAITVSGDEEAAAGWAERWRRRGRNTQQLRVSHAFHSARMEPMLAELRELAASLTFAEPTLPIVSDVSGKLAGAEIATPDYWVRHAREAVRFHEGVGAIQAAGGRHFLELGPDAALTVIARACLAAEEGEDPAPAGAAVAALRGGRPEPRALAEAFAELVAHGAGVDFEPLLAEGRLVDLPTYPFRHRRYFWQPAAAGGDVSAAGLDPVDHPFLGTAQSLAEEDGWVLSGRISLETFPWLADYALLGGPVVPAAALAELALRAARHVGLATVRELTFEAPLALSEERPLLLQLRIGGADSAGTRRLGIFARFESGTADGGAPRWARHASAILAPAELVEQEPAAAGEAAREPLAVEQLRFRLAELGEVRGPAFRTLRAAWREGKDMRAELRLDEDLAGGGAAFDIHPALLQAAWEPLAADAVGPVEPYALRDLRLAVRGAKSLRATLVRSGEGAVALRGEDEDGTAVVSVGAVEFGAVRRGVLEAARGAAGGGAHAAAIPPVSAAAVAAPAAPAAEPEPAPVAAGADGLSRLADLPAEERDEYVLTAVRAAAASVLGEAAAADVPPDRQLLELGLDSVGAVQMYERLARESGLELPPTMVADHPTPRAIAGYLRSRLEPAAGDGSANGQAALSGNGPAAGAGTLTALMRGAYERGALAETFTVLAEASSLQPTFATAEEAGGDFAATRLAAGEESPRLVCVHSFVPGSGPHQFVRLAAAFEGRRHVSALAVPGFRRGERLPASRRVAVAALREAALQAAEGEPFVLVGYSSGGALARALAERLEWEGDPVAGLVLLDAYEHRPGELSKPFEAAVSALLARDYDYVAIDDDNLLAGGAYMRMFRDWSPGELALPSVLLRAEDGLFDAPAGETCMAAQVVEVTADHFSILEEDAEGAARAIEEWMAGSAAVSGDSVGREG